MTNTILAKRLVAAALLTLSGVAVRADDWPQWRGPNRDGVSQERGLVKEWPQDGPKLLWQIDDLGDGYSTPSVSHGRIYVIANMGLDDESVKALDANDGKVVWATRLGKVGKPDQKPSYPAARSTPTVEGAWLFALGSDGDLACLEAATGKVRWQMNIRDEFSGKPGNWAYAESPLIDGERLICTPGGSEATMVALDKTTGKVIWKAALSEADEAAYSSAVVLEAGGVRQYVQLLQKGLVGVDARNGKLLWRYAKPISPFNANIPTPVVAGGEVYVASAGTGGGTVKLTKTSDDAFEPEELYFAPKLPTAIGGVVKLGDYLYGTTAQAMVCIEFATGKIKWQERALGAASLCYADGRLYLHGENGEVALVEASPESYREKGRFTPPNQPQTPKSMGKAWAYPVVANGRLYIRDRDMLWAFDVKDAAPARADADRVRFTTVTAGARIKP
ncbi:MAG TPA: PQQ-binding-like beta-propeller repeat protein [Pirellulales bacterium]|nr:PQQ-binding-like beta-propeller repeat protein [Pirellulales bacterium]